jgi:hypothetical protein
MPSRQFSWRSKISSLQPKPGCSQRFEICTQEFCCCKSRNCPRFSPPGSEDALIKKSVVPKKLPTGEIVFTGVGRKTVNTAEIRARFESLGVQADWKRFDKISGLRNDDDCVPIEGLVGEPGNDRPYSLRPRWSNMSDGPWKHGHGAAARRAHKWRCSPKSACHRMLLL